MIARTFRSPMGQSATWLFLIASGWLALPVSGTSSEAYTRYGSIPKGVILEDSAIGMDPVQQLGYDRRTHELVLNETMRYAFPLSPDETAAILRSLSRDDRLGVSIVLGERRIVYGTLAAGDSVMRSLFAADVFLVSVVFAWRENLAGVDLPGDYLPLRPAARTRRTVCFSRFDRYVFEKQGNRYSRRSCRLELTLVPMAKSRAADGGYLPDYEALRNSDFEPTDLANRAEVHRHAEEYLRLPVVARPALIGEVAAVARHLRDAGVNLTDLASQVEAARPSDPKQTESPVAIAVERRLTDFSLNAPDPDMPALEKQSPGSDTETSKQGGPFVLHIAHDEAAERARLSSRDRTDKYRTGVPEESTCVSSRRSRSEPAECLRR